VSFDLEAFSDRELIHLFADLRGSNGHVTVAEIVQRLGMPEERGSTTSVSVRLGWMRRYGVVERGELGWKLTEAGEAVLRARKPVRLVSQVDHASDGQLLEATHALAVRRQQAGESFKTLSRREWQRELRRSRGTL
jgi:hypothetical protein